MFESNLRKNIISKRKVLSQTERLSAAKQITQHLLFNLPAFQQSEHIAFYQATNGEADPRLLLNHALSLGKHCYLPVLHPIKHNSMWFMPYKKGTKLIPNQFGILEPEVISHELAPAWALQLVFTPLVAFDLQGNRLGMGGGYYDRSFAFIKEAHFKPKPFLVGLAYEFQKVEKLTANSWDIPLNTVVTEHKIYNFHDHK